MKRDCSCILVAFLTINLGYAVLISVSLVPVSILVFSHRSISFVVRMFGEDFIKLTL